MKLAGLFYFAVLGFSFSINGHTEEDFKEVFSCNFRDGKDMGDLMAVRDYYVKQATKAGLDLPWAFVWTPVKGDFEYDFLWFNYHADLQAFARFTDAFDAAPAMGPVKARFDSIADCSSDLVQRNKIYDGGQAPVTSPPAFIAAKSCTLNPGVRLKDLDELWRDTARTLDASAAYKAFHFYVVSPFTSGADSPDVFVYGVHDSATAWAERHSTLRNSRAGQGLEQLMNALLTCKTSLWDAHWMVKSPFQDH